MALPKIEEARKLTDQELSAEVIATKRKLFELRLQQATRRLEKTHEFKHTRHRLAQLLTVETERQMKSEVLQGVTTSSLIIDTVPVTQEEE